MKRKSFTHEERRRAVRLWLTSDLSQAEVAHEYGVVAITIAKWVKKYRDELAEAK